MFMCLVWLDTGQKGLPLGRKDAALTTLSCAMVASVVLRVQVTMVVRLLECIESVTLQVCDDVASCAFAHSSADDVD